MSKQTLDELLIDYRSMAADITQRECDGETVTTANITAVDSKAKAQIKKWVEDVIGQDEPTNLTHQSRGNIIGSAANVTNAARNSLRRDQRNKLNES